ncbi:hypothetical protein KI387_039546, partial [Taxus chinensis]
MPYLEDLTRRLTMERQPLTLESAEEVMVHEKEKEKLKIGEKINRYSKLITLVKTMAHMAEAVYDNYGNRDRVKNILISTHEMDLNEFQVRK